MFINRMEKDTPSGYEPHSLITIVIIPLPITGTSMLPLLEEGKALAEVEASDKKQLKKGDVVLYKKNDNTLVLHRIIKIEGEDNFTVLGDHQFKNAERVNKQQIIAIAQGFFINGSYVDENTRWYRIYKRIWLSSLTLRRCCLSIQTHCKCYC